MRVHVAVCMCVVCGQHGRVWLACTSKGKVCVLKFAKDASTAQATLEQEAEVWRACWFKETRVQTFGGEPALVMPFVAPCSKADLDRLKPEIKQAIIVMLKAGFKHNDLCPRHVGVVKQTNGMDKLFLLIWAMLLVFPRRTAPELQSLCLLRLLLSKQHKKHDSSNTNNHQ